MYKSEPVSTSTPMARSLVEKPCPRPGIHDVKEEDPTPIEHSNSEFEEECEDATSKDEDNSKSSSDGGGSSTSQTKAKKNSTFSIYYVFITFVILMIGCVFMSISDNNVDISPNITELHNTFPSQAEDIWYALESGLNDVKTFKKPSVFLFLYDSNAEQTIQNVLMNISRYASCILNNDCNIKPIMLTSIQLNSTEANDDYGYIISKYKSDLEEKNVMIVKNLDNVPGSVAQAFHSFCDDITPLVKKSVFFFTIMVEDFHDKNVVLVKNILRKKWSDLNEDIFDPLLTRISSMVLRVVPERKV